MSTSPSASINIKFNGEARELFMSFALLNRLTYLVGRMEDLHTVMLNPEMRDAVLLEMYAERTPAGKLQKTYPLDECEVSIPDTMSVLDFVSEHLLDFFMGALKKSQALQQKYSIDQVKPGDVKSDLTPTPSGPGT